MMDMPTIIVTIILILAATGGWLFLKRDPQKYIHKNSSPINIFFRWGRFYHHVFKVIVIILVMVGAFVLYRYILGNVFGMSAIAAVAAGVILAGGKELLDKKITMDDVLVSIFGIALGFSILFLF